LCFASAITPPAARISEARRPETLKPV